MTWLHAIQLGAGLVLFSSTGASAQCDAAAYGTCVANNNGNTAPCMQFLAGCGAGGAAAGGAAPAGMMPNMAEVMEWQQCAMQCLTTEIGSGLTAINRNCGFSGSCLPVCMQSIFDYVDAIPGCIFDKCNYAGITGITPEVVAAVRGSIDRITAGHVSMFSGCGTGDGMVNGALQWVQTWNWGFTNGDPHFTTGDGFSYTFNGLGDYWLLKDTDDEVRVQGRIGKCGTSWSGNSQGTCLNAVAVEIGSGDDTDNVEVRKTSSGKLQVFSKSAGQFVTASTTGSSLGATKHDKISIGSDSKSVEITSVVGVKLDVVVSNDIMQVAIGVEKGIPTTRLTGLYGNFDGDNSNDLNPCSTAGLAFAANPSTERELFDFGQTCKVPVGSELMFEDQFSDASESEQNSWQPPFTDELDASELAQNKIKCGQQGLTGARLDQCAFDVTVTGSDAFIGAAKAANDMVTAANNKRTVTLTTKSTAKLDETETTTTTTTMAATESSATRLTVAFGAIVTVFAAQLF